MSFDGNIKATHFEIAYGGISEQSNGASASRRKVFVTIGNNTVLVSPEEAKGFLEAFTDIVVEAEQFNKRAQKRAEQQMRELNKKTKRGTK